MSPFYTEGDSKLVGEPINKSMAKNLATFESFTKCEI